MDRCSECGFVYDPSRAGEVSAAIHDELSAILKLLEVDAGPEVRRDPAIWSPLEYACHLRDVLLVQRERILLARRTETPAFETMGREERVEHDGYAEQHPEDVVRQIRDAALMFGNVLERLGPADWERRVVYNYPTQQERSLAWVAVHTLHEAVHHVADIRRQVT